MEKREEEGKSYTEQAEICRSGRQRLREQGGGENFMLMSP